MNAPDRLSVATPAPGRFCPADYRLGAQAFTASPWQDAEVLYLAGGLYGNTLALDSLLRLFDAEAARSRRLVFNGDFHWFDVDPREFARIEALTAAHGRLRGNVESELARAPLGGDDEAGCGCAYPDEVDDQVVERSNRILNRLKGVAWQLGAAPALGALPMVARCRVGEIGVAITHGDEQSLAGWRLANDRLAQSWQDGLTECLHEIGARVIASSHTCLAVADTHHDRHGWYAAINNGAAGLANFAGSATGLITRIALTGHPLPSAAQEVYRLERDGLRISGLSLPFDLAEWLSCFDRQWPAGSDASLSYRERVMHGTSLEPRAAARGDFVLA